MTLDRAKTFLAQIKFRNCEFKLIGYAGVSLHQFQIQVPGTAESFGVVHVYPISDEQLQLMYPKDFKEFIRKCLVEKETERLLNEIDAAFK